MQAYQAMLKFLENYHENTHSDEIAGLLGSLSISSDGSPMDPACWEEWLEAVEKITSNPQ